MLWLLLLFLLFLFLCWPKPQAPPTQPPTFTGAMPLLFLGGANAVNKRTYRVYDCRGEGRERASAEPVVNGSRGALPRCRAAAQLHERRCQPSAPTTTTTGGLSYCRGLPNAGVHHHAASHHGPRLRSSAGQSLPCGGGGGGVSTPPPTPRRGQASRGGTGAAPQGGGVAVEGAGGSGERGRASARVKRPVPKVQDRMYARASAKRRRRRRRRKKGAVAEACEGNRPQRRAPRLCLRPSALTPPYRARRAPPRECRRVAGTPNAQRTPPFPQPSAAGGPPPPPPLPPLLLLLLLLPLLPLLCRC